MIEKKEAVEALKIAMKYLCQEEQFVKANAIKCIIDFLTNKIKLENNNGQVNYSSGNSSINASQNINYEKES
jgi:hypothetical protein